MSQMSNQFLFWQVIVASLHPLDLPGGDASYGGHYWKSSGLELLKKQLHAREALLCKAPLVGRLINTASGYAAGGSNRDRSVSKGAL